MSIDIHGLAVPHTAHPRATQVSLRSSGFVKETYAQVRHCPRWREILPTLLAMALCLLAYGEAHAAIGWRAASSANSGSGTATSLAINKPSGVANGDFMLAQVSAGTTITITAPSGWTLVRSFSDGAYRGSVYRKLAGSSEPASYTWRFSGGARVAGGIAAFTGVDATSPIQTENGTVEEGSQATHTTPTIATTGSSTWLVSLFGDRNGTGSTWTSSGATERVDTRSTGTAAASVSIYTQGPVAAGNYSRTGTASSLSDLESRRFFHPADLAAGERAVSTGC